MSSLPESLLRFRDDLEAAIRREQEAKAVRVLRPFRRRPGRAVLAVIALAGAVVVALFVSTPWQSSTFLERAQAALTPPGESVLRQRVEVTWTSVAEGCKTAGVVENWIDQTPPHRYRFFLQLPSGPCALEPRIELGGARGEGSLRFDPPNTLTDNGVGFFGPPDPVQELREALADGSARHEGRTTLDGRVVDRIVYAETSACPGAPCPPHAHVAYVDPRTLEPVQIEQPYGFYGPGGHFHAVLRFLAYDYLPRTDDNVALTDIRAQHPDAIER